MRRSDNVHASDEGSNRLLHAISALRNTLAEAACADASTSLRLS
jgi:hypothetical protein